MWNLIGQIWDIFGTNVGHIRDIYGTFLEIPILFD